jgi:hypothetical protein
MAHNGEEPPKIDQIDHENPSAPGPPSSHEPSDEEPQVSPHSAKGIGGRRERGATSVAFLAGK